jgi:hypothetical protein
MEEIRYHIYNKNRCVNYNLSEEDFNKIWVDYQHLSEIHGNLNSTDLSFEKVVYNKKDYSLQGV